MGGVEPPRTDLPGSLPALVKPSAGPLEVGDTRLDWFRHPRVARIAETILEKIQSKEFHFRKMKPVIFLCGAKDSSARDELRDYIQANWGHDFLVFYAEDVWNVIAGRTDLNALKMEQALADLADVVAVIVESPGTFAEVGAFSLSDDLRPKLLLVIDKQFQHSESFINTGPVRWTDQDSLFSPAIYTDLKVVLESIGELSERLGRLPAPARSTIDDLTESPKHLLFFLCDLVAVFGPVTLDHVERLFTELLGRGPHGLPPAYLLALGTSLGLLETKIVDGTVYYLRVPEDAETFNFFHRKKFLDLALERARFLSALITLPSGRRVLEGIS